MKPGKKLATVQLTPRLTMRRFDTEKPDIEHRHHALGERHKTSSGARCLLQLVAISGFFAMSLNSCISDQQMQDRAAIYPAYAPQYGRPSSPPRIVRVSEAARNGIPPGGEDVVPGDYASFRNSIDYRTTFSTWRDDTLLNSDGQKSVVIELGNQRGQCFVNGAVAMDFPVCTGSGKHHTPTGIFHITQKDRDHRSNLYHCDMPYFMRLTGDGIGMHVGDVFRVPASHGCIRITRAACMDLFRTLPHGTEVCIRD